MQDETKKELEKIEEPKAPVLDSNFIMIQLGAMFLIGIAVGVIIAGIAIGYSWGTSVGEVFMLLDGGVMMLLGVRFYKRGLKEKHEAYRQHERQVADYKISMENMKHTIFIDIA